MSESQFLELLARRLDYIEEHLARIGAAVGYQYVTTMSASGVPPQVEALVRAGKKIQAISLYRQLTGVDLKVAKDVVDGIR
jgi:ribosomal protein L7/L12